MLLYNHYPGQIHDKIIYLEKNRRTPLNNETKGWIDDICPDRLSSIHLVNLFHHVNLPIELISCCILLFFS